MFFITLIIIFSFFLLLNKFLIKNKYLLNFSGSSHQKFSGKTDVPLSGGVLILFALIFLFYENTEIVFFVFLLFCSGLISDLNLIISPKIRFLIQSILIFIFVYLVDLQIPSTRIHILDILISNQMVSYFFTTFCFLILINGSNFIDGLNGILLGYYLIILFVIYTLNLNELIFFEDTEILYLIAVMIFLVCLNFFNKTFMGDNGAYILSFFIGFILVEIYSANEVVSPFFVALLLWYPCFENFFSILRKFQLRKSQIKPDNNHLHQLVFYFVKQKKKF